jgi:Zn-dependent protease
VHSAELKKISQAAEQAAVSGDFQTALQEWRQVLERLPASSRQHAVISARIASLGEHVAAAEPAMPQSSRVPDAPASSGSKSGWAKSLGGIGAAGLVLWKFKFIAAFLLTKAKLLLLGFTKAGTVFTMLASLGVYWTEWGWKFALGLVLSIYVHEMGHVAALRRYGLPASAPMFIPGLGAFVRLKQMPVNPREDARIGLAGPIWGTAAALVTFGIGVAAHWPAWMAVAHVAAWINLFNLLPVWQLDGSRGFRTLDRTSRILIVVVVALMWNYTMEGMLVLVLIFAGLRAFFETAPKERDYSATVQFACLLTVLSILCVRSAPQM